MLLWGDKRGTMQGRHGRSARRRIRLHMELAELFLERPQVGVPPKLHRVRDALDAGGRSAPPRARRSAPDRMTAAPGWDRR